MKALIVDDDNNILSMLTTFLTKVGWTVVPARGTEEARALLDDTVDVAVSDIRMDNQSGVDLLIDIRRSFPCLEVILMSGYDEARELVEQIGIQAFAYLKKPFDLAEFNRLLLAAVRSKDKSMLEINLRERLKNEGLRTAGDSSLADLSEHRNLDFIPLPLMILNADLEITGCNPPAAALFGRTQEEMTGRRLSSILRDGLEHRSAYQTESGPPATEAAGICMESDQETLFLFPGNPAGKILRGIIMRFAPPSDNSFIIMLEDFTEQNEVAFRHEFATRKLVLSEIASLASHEINQPLNAISSYVQLLKYRLDSGRGMTAEELGQMCQEMLTEIDRLNSFIKSARDSSALRKEQPSPRRFDLRTQYYSTTKLIRGLILHQGIELEEDFPASLPYVAADPLRTGKAFECLLLNAMEAINAFRASGSGAPGLIRVSAARSELDGRAGVRFQVRDSASGVSPEIRGKVFEPLFTSAENPSRQGIDLTVAYAILRGFEGGLMLEAATGNGSCLSFWLPEAEKTNDAG